jgi:hypothetical protein
LIHLPGDDIDEVGQRLVPYQMSVVVIDLFEIIDVEKDEGDRIPLFFRLFEVFGYSFPQIPQVMYACQFVCIYEALQFFFADFFVHVQTILFKAYTKGYRDNFLENRHFEQSPLGMIYEVIFLNFAGDGDV